MIISNKNKRKISLERKIFLCVDVILLLFLIAVCFYPIYYVICASLSNSNIFMAHSTDVLLYPLKPTIAAFAAVLKNKMIITGYTNTLFVVIVGTSLNMLLSLFGAYFLTRKNVMLQKPIMLFILFTMFFSGGIIPLYLLVKGLHLLNSLWALILPGLISTYNLVIMKSSIEQNLPVELEEAAKIDGAGHFRILFNIVTPLSKAIIAVMILFYGVEHWNAWFHASLFIDDRRLYPLQLVLRQILIQNSTGVMTQGASAIDGASVAETIKYAVIVVATLPILMVYPFLQKYFVKGIALGAVKG